MTLSQLELLGNNTISDNNSDSKTMESIGNDNRKRKLFCICHALLDFIYDGTDDCSLNEKDAVRLIAEYNMKPNQGILANPHQHCKIFNKMRIATTDSHVSTEKEVKFKKIPGGTGLNSIRTAQQFLPVDSTIFAGIVGDDPEAIYLKEAVQKDGVKFLKLEKTATIIPKEEVNGNDFTGRCFVLVTGRNRSMATFMGASKLIKQKHLDDPAVQMAMAECSLFYLCGYMLTDSFEVVKSIAEYCHKEKEKELVFNLSMNYICLNQADKIVELLPMINIIVGNVEEVLAFGQGIIQSKRNGHDHVTNDKNDLDVIDRLHGKNNEDEIFLKQTVNYLATYNGGNRIVIITNDKHPTMLFSNGKFSYHKVPMVEENAIVDTTGAGDVFIGAFMSEYIKETSTIEECIAFGNRQATRAIQISGVQFPLPLGNYRTKE